LAEKLFGDDQQMEVKIEGYVPAPDEYILIDYNIVTNDYFQTMGIPILQGRDFNEQDREGSQRVVIINEAMARRYWHDDNPIGKRLSFGESAYVTVIGIVKNAKYYKLREEQLPYMYLPYYQIYEPSMTINAKFEGNPNTIITAIQGELQALDRDLPIIGAKTLAEHMGISLIEQKIAATLLGIFGTLALFLAVVGIYGTISYTVNQRTREIGVRMALGAKQADVLKLILGQAMFLVLIGMTIGLIMALGLTRFISSLLYGVNPADPLAFAGISFLLISAALLASYLPARKASKIDPAIALRHR
jgi:predicted permease